MKYRLCILVCATLGLTFPNFQIQNAMASEADVVKVVATKSGGVNERKFRFDVTLKHADSGWDHYADKWEIIAPDGTVLGKRVLAHPHVNEQPFTRSLNNVVIPANVMEVTIRAGDNLGKGFGKTMKIVLGE